MSLSPEDEAALRSIAKNISEYRKEHLEALAGEVQQEMITVVKSGFDPARGRRRGPWWAEGA